VFAANVCADGGLADTQWVCAVTNVTQRRPLRVLLVDDDADMLVMLQAMLTSRAVDVVGLATNGEDAEQVAIVIGPDVAVVDYMMPGLTGFETATKIKSVRPECVVVIFSALADLADEALAQPDVDHFIAKTNLLQLDELLNEMRAERA